ncbi:MAG: hypothetical protein QW566_04585 [Candidatus Jordarchaeales archaeon]
MAGSHTYAMISKHWIAVAKAGRAQGSGYAHPSLEGIFTRLVSQHEED